MYHHLHFVLIMTLSFMFSSSGTSDPEGFIVAGSDGGLSNRLRALVAYMHVAKVKYNNAELGNLPSFALDISLSISFIASHLAYVHNFYIVFVWDVNAACPGHFLEIFRPLDGVTFIKNASRPSFEPSAKASFPNTR